MTRNLNGVGSAAIDTLKNQVEVTVWPPEEVTAVSQQLSGFGDAVNVVASSAAPTY